MQRCCWLHITDHTHHTGAQAFTSYSVWCVHYSNASITIGMSWRNFGFSLAFILNDWNLFGTLLTFGMGISYFIEENFAANLIVNLFLWLSGVACRRAALRHTRFSALARRKLIHFSFSINKSWASTAVLPPHSDHINSHFDSNATLWSLNSPECCTQVARTRRQKQSLISNCFLIFFLLFPSKQKYRETNSIWIH